MLVDIGMMCAIRSRMQGRCKVLRIRYKHGLASTYAVTGRFRVWGEAAPLSRALAFVELICSDLEQITAAREGPASRENPRHQRHSNPVRMFWHVCCVDNWVVRFAFFG